MKEFMFRRTLPLHVYFVKFVIIPDQRSRL